MATNTAPTTPLTTVIDRAVNDLATLDEQIKSAAEQLAAAAVKVATEAETAAGAGVVFAAGLAAKGAAVDELVARRTAKAEDLAALRWAAAADTEEA